MRSLFTELVVGILRKCRFSSCFCGGGGEFCVVLFSLRSFSSLLFFLLFVFFSCVP